MRNGWSQVELGNREEQRENLRNQIDRDQENLREERRLEGNSRHQKEQRPEGNSGRRNQGIRGNSVFCADITEKAISERSRSGSEISGRARESLRKRADAVRFQKRMIAVIAILAVSFLVLLGSSIRAFASGRNTTEPMYQYYTSIRIESGDTLWTIADSYSEGSGMDRNEYIEEVRRINGLDSTQIHSGRYLVVPYYSQIRK